MSTSDTSPATPSGSSQKGLSIAETAEIIGISAAALRQWEARFGWPQPEREANGYRTFSPQLVNDLKRVVAIVKRGGYIGDAIAQVRYPSQPAVQKPVRPNIDFSVIPQPRSAEGVRLRGILEESIRLDDTGKIAWVKAQAPLLHPQERDTAIIALLRLAGLS
jgi:DNA-binding transcriptional MerR regulator